MATINRWFVNGLVISTAGCGLLVGVDDVETRTGTGAGGATSSAGGGGQHEGGGGADGGGGQGPQGECGDGVTEGEEECDDGNTDDYDACLKTCKKATCGDGLVWSGIEDCDDANTSNEDACVVGCIQARCGDGYVRIGVEGCDDGNTVDTDGCTNECALPTCGDGELQAGEACDDGDQDNTDDCLTTCQLASCGDGHVKAMSAEACDDGNLTDTDACTSQCLVNVCGDGFQNVGVEGCDDGNNSDSDSCVSGCVDASCGDGYTWTGVEECDDANASNTDACLVGCVAASCGDGYVEAGMEACDDGDSDDTDACLSTCEVASCGDGHVYAGMEVCDDGNSATGDGCFACEQVEEIAAGWSHACARMSDGAVKCWGDGTYGKLGQGNASHVGDGPGELAALSPIPLGEPAVHVAGGYSHTCAILQSGAVKCWGSNDWGELGIGATSQALGDGPGEIAALPSVAVGGTATKLALGYLHSCALLAGGGVKCWGYNFEGELGIGNTTSTTGPQPVDLGGTAADIGLFAVHTCARMTTGAIKCWGQNDGGALGIEQPVSVNIGDAPGEMGAGLATTISGADGMTVGEFMTCALLGQSVKCWGSGAGGRLGTGDTANWGDAAGEMTNLPFVNVGADVTAVVAGRGTTCAILVGGQLKCWGNATAAGHGNLASTGDTPGSMGQNLPITQLASPAEAVLQVVVGQYFACALLDSRRVKCWGVGTEGQNGSGATATLGDGPGEMGNALSALPLP